MTNENNAQSGKIVSTSPVVQPGESEEFSSKLGLKGHLLIWIPLIFIIVVGIMARFGD